VKLQPQGADGSAGTIYEQSLVYHVEVRRGDRVSFKGTRAK
jgi:hypothetical protein